MSKILVEKRKAKNMGVYLNPDNTNFQENRNSDIFVDKTGLLVQMNRILGSSDKFFCVSRPRRFGKTMALNSMIAYYSRSCDSKELFEGLEISKNESFEKHLNAYDVIRLDMNGFAEYGKDFINELQRRVIKELKDEYIDLDIDESMKLKDVIQTINQAYGIQYIFLIDEWDMVFRKFKNDDSLQQEYIQFLSGLFKDESFNHCIKLVYLTGILPIKKYKIQSALNNFREYTVIRSGKLSKYYGFTEEEVKELSDEHNLNYSLVKEWYDGYKIGNANIYNPNSVVECIRFNEYGSYWTKTESYEDLKDYIELNFDGLKEALNELYLGNKIYVRTGNFNNDLHSIHSKDNVLTALIYLGYLTYDYETKTCWIPNKEIKEQFEDTLADSNKIDIITRYQQSKELLDLILKGKENKFSNKIREYHHEYVSLHDYNHEIALKYMLKAAFDGNRDEYIIKDEFSSGEGIIDLVMIPKKNINKPSIIIECKWDMDVNVAIQQIKEKRYMNNDLLSDDVILVGISYDKKTKEHSCRIEHIEEE